MNFSNPYRPFPSDAFPFLYHIFHRLFSAPDDSLYLLSRQIPFFVENLIHRLTKLFHRKTYLFFIIKNQYAFLPEITILITVNAIHVLSVDRPDILQGLHHPIHCCNTDRRILTHGLVINLFTARTLVRKNDVDQEFSLIRNPKAILPQFFKNTLSLLHVYAPPSSFHIMYHSPAPSVSFTCCLSCSSRLCFCSLRYGRLRMHRNSRRRNSFQSAYRVSCSVQPGQPPKLIPIPLGSYPHYLIKKKTYKPLLSIFHFALQQKMASFMVSID